MKLAEDEAQVPSTGPGRGFMWSSAFVTLSKVRCFCILFLTEDHRTVSASGPNNDLSPPLPRQMARWGQSESDKHWAENALREGLVGTSENKNLKHGEAERPRELTLFSKLRLCLALGSLLGQHTQPPTPPPPPPQDPLTDTGSLRAAFCILGCSALSPEQSHPRFVDLPSISIPSVSGAQ